MTLSKAKLKQNARHLLRGLLLLPLISLAGCHTAKHAIPLQPPYTVYRSPNLLVAPPRRVLVLPTLSTAFDGGYSGRWYHLLVAELRGIKRFDVVTTTPDAPGVRRCIEQAQLGLYDETDLITLRDHFRVDAVMFVELNDFDPYWPPRMAVSLDLVDVYRGETIASVDGIWDGRDERVRVMIRDLGQYVTTANELGDPDIILQSPEYFGKFVARDAALALCKLFYNDLVAEAAPAETAPVAAFQEPFDAANESSVVEGSEQEVTLEAAPPTTEPLAAPAIDLIPRRTQAEELPSPHPSESVGPIFID